ncbi:MAG: PEP-CTERM sorting domain-containing protein [Lentimonas sp.]
MKKHYPILLVSLAVASSASANLLTNTALTQAGDGTIAGWEAYGNFSGPDADPSAGFGSAWGVADAPVVGNGDGSATFGMNDQLPTADPFWAGADQLMVFQHNFWTPDNGNGVAAGALDYGDTFTFSGNVVVSEAYDAGNEGQVFVQFLDSNWNATYQNIVNIETLDGGDFSIDTAIPADASLNIVQVGFRNAGVVETAGEMTFSNLAVTIVPEPSSLGIVFGLVALASLSRRRI